MNKVLIYGYFSLKDFKDFTFHQERTNEIKTFDIKKGDCLYIGVDSNGERHANHLKPSKKKLSALNSFIQDNPDDWVLKEFGTAINKSMAHPIEIKMIGDFHPLMNTYGNDVKKGDTKKLTLTDLDKTFKVLDKKETKRFNTIEALGKIIDEDKIIMFTHKAKNVDVIAAKDTGKSFPLDMFKHYAMEKDPMASSLTLMKYSTKSGAKGIRSLSKAYGGILKEGFEMPRVYEASTGFYYRLPKGKKISRDLGTKMKSQFIQFGSFQDSDDLASFVVANGGYPHLIHIEEPVMQGDTGTTPTLKQWNADVKTIEDTVKRHYRDYNLSIRDEKGVLLPHKYDPIPFKIITTMNDWDPEHPVSKRAEKYHPQSKFLDWALGFEYSKLLNLWQDKIIDSETVVFELKDVIDKNWDDIKKSVVKKHTQWIYIERDSMGRKEDRLIGRMQKFANPVARNDETTKQEIFDEMYNALITGDTLGLAKAFGMGFGGTVDEDKQFIFKNFKPIDTDKKLKEEGRKLLGFVVSWDHDANRGPVATPTTISAKKINVGNPFQPEWEYTDIKHMIHEQIFIEGYGKGKAGKNTKKYHEQMIVITRELYNKYVGNPDRELEEGKFIIVDDDNGSIMGHISDDLIDIGFDDGDSLPNKNGDNPYKGGFSVKLRDEIWQTGIEIEDILVDDKNVMLVDWLKQVPATLDVKGEKKRSTKGKWGSRYKDVSNSAEYGFFYWISWLYDGLNN